MTIIFPWPDQPTSASIDTCWTRSDVICDYCSCNTVAPSVGTVILANLHPYWHCICCFWEWWYFSTAKQGQLCWYSWIQCGCPLPRSMPGLLHQQNIPKSQFDLCLLYILISLKLSFLMLSCLRSFRYSKVQIVLCRRTSTCITKIEHGIKIVPWSFLPKKMCVCICRDI